MPNNPFNVKLQLLASINNLKIVFNNKKKLKDRANKKYEFKFIEYFELMKSPKRVISKIDPN